MQLVEQHNLKGKQWKEADDLCFRSKNLYNLGLYHVRQHFFEKESYLNYNQLDKLLQSTEAYKSLPAKVSQQILIQLDRNFRSFFNALQSWKTDPSKFTGKPRIPGYKDKTKGRNLAVFTDQAISKRLLKKFKIAKLSKTEIAIHTLKENINQVRIVPTSTGGYVAEIVFEQEPVKAATDSKKHLSIDLGVNNLLAMTSDQKDFQPLLVSGGAGKSINQWFNKQRSKMQEQLNPEQAVSKAILRLTQKRNRKIRHLFHQVSRFVVQTAIEHGIGTIVIGKNKEWKQEVNLGKRTNQNFVSLPFNQLIQQIDYKSELVGIKVHLQEEAHTSKCSALDLESVEHHENYLGKRVKRGLFKTAEGILLNSDVNGSCNIMRKHLKKEFQKSSENWIEAIVVWPKRMVFQA
ncbi:MAG: Transposase, IS605 OrfB family [Candidatus Woesebacteria bacterium GW2011_GWB1_39_12]|uniref:Transposase, IS605 OrfB family n=1 Tax=Candidatus Woesebacteria bacterium GW2011_GWB1_39_12 TaxID=1618574 RepID=A0A0G0MIN3_9BACT|nr:MAG: Transposase, IS605 OrfB family [Candidatus Woesebacteria bacterium GW2011_GWB1_39_12]